MIINENIICQSYNDNTYQSEIIDDKKYMLTQFMDIFNQLILNIIDNIIRWKN